MTSPRSIALAALLTAALLPASAAAQQNTCKAPNERQLAANNAGALAMKENRADDAAKIFKKSIDDDGDLNITYLNLGRAYQKLNRCREAAEAYQRALETNRCVPSPDPAKIREVTAQFRAELEATCPGEVTFTCSPPSLMIRVGDQPARACSELSSLKPPLQLPPGKYEVVGEVRGQTVTQQIEVRPIQTTPVALSVAVVGPNPEDGIVKKDDGTVTPPPAVEPVDGDAAMWGWVQVGVGGALIITSVILDFAPDSASNDQFDGLDVVPAAGYLVGGLLVANGLRMTF